MAHYTDLLDNNLKSELLITVRNLGENSSPINKEKKKFARLNTSLLCDSVFNYFKKLPDCGSVINDEQRIVLYNLRYLIKGLYYIMELKFEETFTFESFIKNKEKLVRLKEVQKNVLRQPETSLAAFTLKLAKKKKAKRASPRLEGINQEINDICTEIGNVHLRREPLTIEDVEPRFIDPLGIPFGLTSHREKPFDDDVVLLEELFSKSDRMGELRGADPGTRESNVQSINASARSEPVDISGYLPAPEVVPNGLLEEPQPGALVLDPPVEAVATPVRPSTGKIVDLSTDLLRGEEMSAQKTLEKLDTPNHFMDNTPQMEPKLQHTPRSSTKSKRKNSLRTQTLIPRKAIHEQCLPRDIDLPAVLILNPHLKRLLTEEEQMNNKNPLAFPFYLEHCAPPWKRSELDFRNLDDADLDEVLALRRLPGDEHGENSSRGHSMRRSNFSVSELSVILSTELDTASVAVPEQPIIEEQRNEVRKLFHESEDKAGFHSVTSKSLPIQNSYQPSGSPESKRRKTAKRVEDASAQMTELTSINNASHHKSINENQGISLQLIPDIQDTLREPKESLIGNNLDHEKLSEVLEEVWNENQGLAKFSNISPKYTSTRYEAAKTFSLLLLLWKKNIVRLYQENSNPDFIFISRSGEPRPTNI